jgi:hypothetical protein
MRSGVVPVCVRNSDKDLVCHVGNRHRLEFCAIDHLLLETVMVSQTARQSMVATLGFHLMV